MTKFDYSLAGFSLGGCCALLLVIFISQNEPTKTQVSFTRQQLKEMKAECEKDLPRSAECSIVVYYLPQAELEKTE